MLGPWSSPRDSQTSTGDRRDCVDCSHGIGGTATPLTSSGPCKRELYRWPPGFASSLKRATETQRDANAYALEVLQRLEDELTGNLNTVRGGLRALREDVQLNESRLATNQAPDRK